MWLLPVQEHLRIQRRVVSVPEPRRSTHKHAPVRTRSAVVGGCWFTADVGRSTWQQHCRCCWRGPDRHRHCAHRRAGSVDCRVPAQTHRVSGLVAARRQARGAVRPRGDVAHRHAFAGRAQRADGDLRHRHAAARGGHALGTPLGPSSRGAAAFSQVRFRRRPAGPWHGTGGDSRLRDVR